MLRAIQRLLVPVLTLLLTPTGSAQITVQPPFDADYTVTDLGSVPGLPPLYGGLIVRNGDNGTLLIGGHANTAAGQIHQVGLVRDPANHIIGFDGEATFYSEGAYNDGGIAYAPGNVLLLARWPVNELGQTKPGSSVTDKIIDLTPFGITSSPGGLNFVPAGFPGAGQLKFVSWPGGQWFTVSIEPDDFGTYDITGAVSETQIIGGPEGFIYVPAGSPQFTDYQNMLVSEYSAGRIAAYDLDAQGNPIPGSRVDFITGLTGAEGAMIDPLTGDYLFSTFGGGDRVVVVRGFAPLIHDFVRSDANGDATIDISDAVFTLAYLFLVGPGPCVDAMDANDDGEVSISDPAYLLTYLFQFGPVPPAPFPSCGADPTSDLLDCEVFGPCP
ncbi:MAG: hypothetical protein KDC38_06575 [Planctomycetes bacterium]|nr:hypothetical protein [Planctomycetota bacterium]